MKDNKFHSCTKHIDLRYHFIWEAVEDNKISFSYIPMNENVSDVLTYKGTGKAKIRMICQSAGIEEVRKKGEGRKNNKKRSVCYKLSLTDVIFICTFHHHMVTHMQMTINLGITRGGVLELCECPSLIPYVFFYLIFRLDCFLDQSYIIKFVFRVNICIYMSQLTY